MQPHNTGSQPAVEKSVEIAASPGEVWRMLTETAQIATWMDGAQVASTWEPGGEITFRGTMPNFNKKYHDRGTVLSVERERHLQYSHWSEMSRRPDLPQNRSLITFTLEPVAGGTRLAFRHENFHSEVEYKHANFFWGVAL